MQELRIAYRSIVWMAAIGGYLLLHYRQWVPAAGYVVGAAFAALALWSLQQLTCTLGAATTYPWRWWWKSALWRYPLMLLVLWVVSRQSISFISGFVAGVTLLPLAMSVLAFSRVWRRPAWLHIRYWTPKAVHKSREM